MNGTLSGRLKRRHGEDEEPLMRLSQPEACLRAYE